jgi:ribosomal protein L40E
MADNTENFEESEEKQLCVKCLAPNDPNAHFCEKCGTQLSSYAAIGPYEAVFSEAGIYRAAAEGPHNLLVMLGIWVIFGIVLMTGILLCVMASGEFLYVVFGAVCCAFSILMLVKTTRNYFGKGKGKLEVGPEPPTEPTENS